uniref:Uncharacterized protein LOC114344736 n=1 Tax=Diabrotica virgifera virgifera TaxID=50390 RepID=A0A6P7GZ10_DIAVI
MENINQEASNGSFEMEPNHDENIQIGESTECCQVLNTELAENSTKNELGVRKLDGEIRKGLKKKDFCFYCESLVLNFARHTLRNHASEIEVQKILSLPPKNIERKRLLDVIRKKGNYLNSNDICKPIQKSHSENDVLPCTNCLGFYSVKTLWRHRNKCIGLKSKGHQSSAQNLLLANLKVDSQLRQTVFPRMRPDKISLVAKKDSLICAFGARYIKIHREKHFINVASQKMRELARLLIQIKQRDESIKCLLDALKSKHFDLLVEATKAEAKYDADKDIYKSPTYALNMGTTLKQCAELAIIMVLKRKNIAETVSSAETEADLKTLIQVLQSQWQYEISSQAANDLNINKWNKITLVPLASDLKLLKENLITKATSAVAALDADSNDTDSYTILLETIFCRVMLLNRRRPGELQRLTLDIYENVKENKSNYEEFFEVISPSERILLNRFKRVVIRGKRGRGVPVLFSTDVQEHITILLKHRKDLVEKGNLYLFGKINSLQPICGYKVLSKYARACGAKNPDALTSTKLRKHLATLTQLFAMSDNDLEQLANFMGHTIGIHKGSYRLPDDIYQTAKISKLLLLMEQGGAAQFKGKSLNDIDLDLEENLLNTDDNMPITEATDLIPEVNICENEASGINSTVALSGASNSSKEQNKKEKRSNN